MRPAITEHDVAVIGAGTAGLAAYRAATEGRVPAGRFARPEEIAALLLRQGQADCAVGD